MSLRRARDVFSVLQNDLYNRVEKGSFRRVEDVREDWPGIVHGVLRKAMQDGAVIAKSRAEPYCSAGAKSRFKL